MAASILPGGNFCKSPLFSVFSALILLLILSKSFLKADDILGCGGFVKSDAPIQFSRVEVTLSTKQGVVKYRTDCAPNNGYYLIPVYDKGDYILQVEPPAGWTFEPRGVSLRIDGTSDICSQSKDINFYFKGFSIYGKLLSRGSMEGPAGVPIELSLAAAPEKPLQTTTSDIKGQFGFSVVPSGEYVVRASGDSLNYDRKTSPVIVSGDNGQIANDLVVSGYELAGKVIGDENEPITGVSFVLFGRFNEVEKRPRNCEPSLPKGIDVALVSARKPLIPLCHVLSSQDGRFVYPLLVPGQYAIVPFYRGENIKFDVTPAVVEVDLKHENLALKQTFRVEGFSVGGRVVTAVGGKGVVGASIVIDGKKVTVTKEDGVFQLENIKARSYKIQVIADRMQFSPTTVKITPNTPYIAELVASAFEVCGVLEGDKSSIRSHPQTVSFVDSNIVGVKKETDSDTNGNFCIWLPSGNYISRVETGSGPSKLIFKPDKLTLQVQDAPISGLLFNQFKAKVSGNVVCLENCDGSVQLILSSLDSASQPVRQTVYVKGSKFEFGDILPGQYELSVVQDWWCWVETTKLIDVNDQDVSDLTFRQKGYLLSVTSSHQTTVSFRYEDSKTTVNKESDAKNTETTNTSKSTAKVGELSINKGNNRLCLEWTGSYELRPVGCHIFSSEHFVYDTASPKAIDLIATRHLLSGTVVSSIATADVKVVVQVVEDGGSNNNGEEAILGPLTAKRRDKQGDYEYLFTYWAMSKKVLELTPQSEELLFYPDKRRLTTVDDCMQYAVEFSGKKGLFLHGKVVPSLGGAKITVVAKDGSIEPIILYTTANGSYRVGPLHGHTEYEVYAEKQGYILTRSVADPNNFDAFKLAEISVLAIDVKTNRPLGSVLVSLSGHSDYRRNSLTSDDGKIVFSDLGPGQFFLRAMMKEFQFDPSSKVVEVKEGATVSVQLKGTRIAFSCYGAVTTLTGDPEVGIVMEALGVDECKSSQEEVKTETDGTFRLMGLKPGCSYEVRPKMGSDVNSHIERTTPKSRHIKISQGDMESTNFIAFRPIRKMDVSGNVVTSKEHLNFLKVRLSYDDTTQQTHSVARSPFFQFLSLPMDGRQYMISLETTLSRSSYDHMSMPEVTFVANETYRHFTLTFLPKPQNSDSDIVQGSYLAIPLALLIIIAICNHSKILPLTSRIPELLQHIGNIGNPIARVREEVVSGTSNTNTGLIDSFMETTNIKKKVKARKVQ